jgi:hypothetical protein
LDQELASLLKLFWLNGRPTEANASLGCKSVVPGDLRLDAVDPDLHALADHAALELGERPSYLEQQPTHRTHRVNVLLVEVNASRLEVLNHAEQVNQRGSDATDRPGHDDVELPPATVIERIERRPLVAAPGVRREAMCRILF